MIIGLAAAQAMAPIPDWSEMHPLIIHFPIVLLLVAPLFILVGIAMNPQAGRPFLIAALALMVLGTVSAFVAVSTGESAAAIAERTPLVSSVLEHHEDLAHTTTVVFSMLTVIFATILFLPRFLKSEIPVAGLRILLLAFLLFYGAGTVVLVNTAHNGGRLVHEFGVHAGLVHARQSGHEVQPQHAGN